MIKKTLLFIPFLAFFNCFENTLPENCIRPFSINLNRSFDNPDFNKILTIGSVEINGGYKGILVINAGLDRFLAYDKLCPASDCDSPMVFDKDSPIPVLKCICDGSTYGLGIGIGGRPQTEGFLCPAIEYNAVKIGNSLRITNF